MLHTILVATCLAALLAIGIWAYFTHKRHGDPSLAVPLIEVFATGLAVLLFVAPWLPMDPVIFLVLILIGGIVLDRIRVKRLKRRRTQMYGHKSY